jgi:hypothetical protein
VEVKADFGVSSARVQRTAGNLSFVSNAMNMERERLKERKGKRMGVVDTVSRKSSTSGKQGMERGSDLTTKQEGSKKQYQAEKKQT